MEGIISTKRLYAIVFSTGAIVMILELIGSRILAPNLGTSTFVWASLIGVILGAMSLGYYYGGKVADSQPNLRTLSRIIFLGGVFVFLIIIFRQTVLDFSTFFGLKTGSIFASVFFFAAPSFFLGMVSPYAVRLDMERVESSGRTVGNLYAVSTFGSIVGTFAAGFYLIPNFGSINILYALALSLFAISFLCYGGKKERQTVSGIALVLLVCALAAQASEGKRYLHYEDSAYNTLRVYDTEKQGRPLRVLSVENFFDSGMYLDGDDLAFEYSEYYALDELFTGRIEKAAIFGGAAYSVPKDFLKRNATGTIDVVEIDPRTTELARRYFKLKDDPRMNIVHQDARIFLNDAAEEKKGYYDILYNDAFSSACAVPSHLTTRESIRNAYETLDEDGSYFINMISAFEGKRSVFFRSEYKTLREVFPYVYVFGVDAEQRSPEEKQNIVLVATKQEKDFEGMRTKAPEDLARLLDARYARAIETDDVRTLTDDFSPVSYYGAIVCDES
jgi:predicted membrane-bound spermidine synthase